MRVNASVISLSQAASLAGIGRVTRGGADAATPPATRGRLGFLLFLLVNLVLFIRPAELFPGMEGWPIYEVAMLGCLLASAGVLIGQLSWSSLKSSPATLCAIGLLPAVVLPYASHGTLYAERKAGM